MVKIYYIFKNIFAILGIILLCIFVYALFSSNESQCTNEELLKITNEINALKSQKAELESNINILKTDLSTLQNTPKTYPAGYLYVGKDIPTGRYKIYDGSSNFIVHDKFGDGKVNIILSSAEERGRVKEYIYYFKDGDQIEADSTFKLMTIE